MKEEVTFADGTYLKIETETDPHVRGSRGFTRFYVNNNEVMMCEIIYELLIPVGYYFIPFEGGEKQKVTIR